MTRTVSRTSNLGQRNSFRAGTPKTRFNLNDGSISSPRLKSFPAERIKRIDRSPVKDSTENANMPPRQVTNSGQGDALSDFQHPQLSRTIAMPYQNITSTSEQQVSRNVRPMENLVNHSDLLIPSNRVENSSIERHQHRPFVPNICQANTTRGENSPRKFVAQSSNVSSQIFHDQIPQFGDNEAFKNPDPWKIENDSTIQVTREHVEDTSEINRSNRVQNLQESPVTPGHEVMPQRSLTTDPNVFNVSHMTDRTVPNFSRKIHPRSNISNFYNNNNNNNNDNHNNNHFQTSGRQFVEINSGMTSPQDVAINRIRNYQRSLQPDNCACTSNQGNIWIRNNQARFTNNGMPVVHDNFPQYHNHPRNNGTQGVPNWHEYSAGNWQQSTNQQYYNRQNDISKQTARQQSNNVKLNNDENRKTPHQEMPNGQENLSGNWQHPTQQQYYKKQREVPSQNPRRSLNSVKLNNHRKIEEISKSLRFSPAMIRDQEILVTTMRQQGINEDIMRRQFDGLLAEQRKQLLYLEQLENSQTNDASKLQQGRRVQCKISRIEEDGKPEWMLHITPPRIPYSVVEKMQSERQVESRVTMRKNPNAVEMTSGNQPHTQKNEINYPSSREYHQHPWQITGSNVCQHQSQNSYVSSNINAPNENQTCHTNGKILDQQRYYGYPVYHEQQLHRQEQKMPAENWQKHENLNEHNQQYEQQERGDKNVEPSSLLKLRVYKEVVKRQKQNNGLQDPETIKEAIEALKNPNNRRGLEYLENLNKKLDKAVSLNGAQDPHEGTIAREQVSYVCHQPTMKIPSANGLENSRNSNNPPPPDTLGRRKINEFHASEYPRQRTNLNFRECYSLMAEKENGNVAMNHQGYNPRGTSNDQTTPCSNDTQTRSDIDDFHYPSQIHPGYHPVPFSQNYQPPNCCVQQIQRYYENPDKTRHQIVPENCHARGIPQPGFFAEQMSGNFQQPELSYARRNNDLHEPVIIGGLKYLARKPEYTRTGISSQHCPTNPGNSFNPTIACQ